jgi:hypothetical protein
MVQRVLPGDRILIGALLAAIALVGFGHSAGLRASSHQAVATSSKPMVDDRAIDARARETEQQMTDDERFSVIISLIGPVPSIKVPRDSRIPEDVKNVSAGYTPGIPRLGIPAIQSSDASLGVTNPGYRPDDKGATAFPSLVALGSSFNPQLVREGGEAIGREARIRGFNVQLAGGSNLARDPRNGRTFEYFSEDPYHTAVGPHGDRRNGRHHPAPDAGGGHAPGAGRPSWTWPAMPAGGG